MSVPIEDGAGPLCIGQAAIDSTCKMPNPSGQAYTERIKLSSPPPELGPI